MGTSRSRTSARRKRRRRIPFAGLLKLALGSLVLLAGVLTVAFIDANWRFSRLGIVAPTRVLSAPFNLEDGLMLDRRDLAERLTRLGYRTARGSPQAPGEFSRRFRAFDIYLNGFDYPDGRAEPTLVRVRLGFGRVTRVEDLDTKETLESIRIEPEVLGVLAGGTHEERSRVALEELPPSLVNATVAVEDRRFYRHPGIDPKAVMRAFFANLRSGEVVQGGSTITQQLAKNLYPDGGDRTIVRKLWESLAAVGLEAFRSKDAILEGYLNNIYLAQRGPVSILGVGAASTHYFGKNVRSLSLAESALLAGLIQSPGRYHPHRHPEEARKRRNLVLRLMHDEQVISKEELEDASARPIELRPEPSPTPRRAPYFVDHVADTLEALGLLESASRHGIRVFTTIDPLLQSRAEKYLRQSLASFERGYPRLRPMPGGELQGAVVALRPEDGAVLAMVGGRDYGRTQFNRVTQAHRQPGSLFKPFVYLAGFRKAQDAQDASFTPATLLDDSPLEMLVGGRLWTPRNFDEQFRGPVTARRALALSMNVPTIRAAQEIGLDEVVQTARRCGIRSPLRAVPSIALGTMEVTPLEVAAAFTPIANLGIRTAPRAVTNLVDERGRSRHVPRPLRENVITPQAAYLTLDLMRDVILYGTGAGLWSYGLKGDFAGKTGTTDEGRDAWFVGFHPDFLALAWVGFDNNRPLKLGGSALALPIWAQLARSAGIDSDRRWTRPEGLVEEVIDPETGLLADWRCREQEWETFIEGSEPREHCDLHADRQPSWASRFLNWFKRNRD
jgi:penicillin-binding protein 1B